MTLASGCGSKTLIRAGAGNLKSVVVLIVLGISAYMTLKGLFAVWRVTGSTRGASTFRPWAPRRPTCRRWLAALGAPAAAKLALPFVLAAALVVFVLKDREFRASPELIVGGIVVGLVIVGGWYVSGHMGYVAEDPATLEEKFFAHQFRPHGVVQLRGARRVHARTADAVERHVADRHVRHRRRARHAGGLGGLRAGVADVPLGGLRLGRGRRQPHRRRDR